MAWFILARLLFLVGVTYTATAVQPLPWGVAVNAGFGAALAAAAIVLESRLADVNVPRILGAVLGAALGLLFAGLIDRSMVVTGDPRWTFFHRVIDLLFDLNREHRTTLVLVTHDESLAARCERHIHLDAGRIVKDH